MAVVTNTALESLHHSRNVWGDTQACARNCVVQVFVDIAEIDMFMPFKTPNQYGARGSGFFINDRGDLITNAHVVDQASEIENGDAGIWIQIPALGKRFIQVSIIGVCPDRDIALLKIDPKEMPFIKEALSEIPYLKLGNSDNAYRTEEVLALGYPLGQESLKSTTGVISGREQDFIQMSAPINPGSSGGPLLNLKGEVIGINSAGVSEAQNVGYIIPINDLKLILPDLYKVKLLRKPFLGILSLNATDSLTDYLGNPQPGGCYVVEVVKDSPLARAGVESGDMIYEVNGNRLDIYGEMTVNWSEDKVSIIDFISRLAIGDEINLVIYRKGVRKEVTAKIDHTNVLPVRKVYPGFEDIDCEVFAGMVVMQLTLNHVKLLGNHAPALMRFAESRYQTEPVLIVTHIFANSELHRSRTILPGVTLNEINGISVKTLQDFRDAIKHGRKNNFLTIKATDNMTRASDNILVVLPFNTVLKETALLSMYYKYPLSKEVQELLKNIH